ncbi:putative quinol monooxygenase [Aliiruegeria sabulilitoris]|uniref:putative quinol monooxygenase n=1 Tax=Aliiruegeria sabulilitoris TaxID=1510458 RepID=UPI00082DB347|nr:antibiotic biosynthesis monooxygenase [Aliiruegeria sabulilitoris]NDR58272.1 antibiotic biosynthesis monooxygenase [Pseudoruegeria sp. M32A2M]
MGITVTGYIDVPEDRRAVVAPAFEEHMRLSLLEPGCEMFELRQDSDVPGRFHVSERYADSDALEAHKARAAASDWARISEGLPRNLEFVED